MILVSAIAANVLISSSTSLQSKALSTGKQAQNQISSGFDIISIVGTNGTDATIENLSITARLTSGSEPIKFNSTTLTIATKDFFAKAKYSTSVSMLNTTTEMGTFSVDYIQTGLSHKEGYMMKDELVEIKLNLDKSIGENEEIKLSIIPIHGFTKTIDFSTNEVITTRTVQLYP